MLRVQESAQCGVSLYQLATDPEQLRNLIAEPRHAAKLAESRLPTLN